MNQLYELAFLVGANCVVVGIAWGTLTSGQKAIQHDITMIKKTLGQENGHLPAFIRREEWDMHRVATDEFARRIDKELEELWNRLDTGPAS